MELNFLLRVNAESVMYQFLLLCTNWNFIPFKPVSTLICSLNQCFSTAGPRLRNGPWLQLYWAARDCPGICHFSFLSNFHE